MTPHFLREFVELFQKGEGKEKECPLEAVLSVGIPLCRERGANKTADVTPGLEHPELFKQLPLRQENE